MACITPGIHKQIVNIKLNMNAPMRPVVKTAAGGKRRQRKYLIIIFRVMDSLIVTIGFYSNHPYFTPCTILKQTPGK
jgi:hypothetical protein